jgi:hypothetical protein
MANPLIVLSVPTLTASPAFFKAPATVVMFASKLLDIAASPDQKNTRGLTLMLDAGTDLSFENGAKSISDSREIGSTTTDVLLTHTISGTGGTDLSINVSQFDDTGKLLGQVLLPKMIHR